MERKLNTQKKASAITSRYSETVFNYKAYSFSMKILYNNNYYNL
jgi:hypothetical protein